MTDTRYAWIITKDYLDGSDDGDTGLTGPSDATDEELTLARTQGFRFRMYDDDGELYYAGRCWVMDDTADDAPAPSTRYPDCIGNLTEDHFGPLNDYGMPGAGCTQIRYRTVIGTGNEKGKYLPL